MISGSIKVGDVVKLNDHNMYYIRELTYDQKYVVLATSDSTYDVYICIYRDTGAYAGVRGWFGSKYFNKVD